METAASSTPLTNHRYLLAFVFSLLLIACEQTDKATTKNTNSANTPATIAKNPANQSSTVEETSSPQSSPTANDIANLNRAMHGAAGQQPDDAPKDQYGKPYIIGSLGGVPVNLPSYSVKFVEYDDSPGFNPEKLRAYNPPTRNYDSVIKSFGFDFRNRDAQLWDINKRELVEGKTKASRGNSADDDWAHVSISAKTEQSNPNFLDDLVAGYQEITEFNQTRLYDRWEPTGREEYGLELYINPGTDPQTGKPWREHENAKDVFVGRSPDGRVQTVIKCGNRDVVNSCTHHFNFQPPFDIRAKLWYVRAQLAHWKKFEDNSTKIIFDFRKD